jgi:protein-L-isoaspartate(D-aspartate) O-methyltransferase
MADPVRPKSPLPVQAAFKAANSNTRIVLPGAARRQGVKASPIVAGALDNLGLTSDRLRLKMVDRVRAQGVSDETVLAALAATPRHLFVDQAFASRAYEDAALPIGHSQTISQPWVVARMLAALSEATVQDSPPQKVLEVGTGCGYQAAVMSHIFKKVYSIERVRPLYDMARGRLQSMSRRNVHLLFGDGMLGWQAHAPFDGIVVAAAGLSVPQALLNQLSVGGRLIAPEGDAVQRLIMVVRVSAQRWVRHELETVRFVPLKPGVQM